MKDQSFGEHAQLHLEQGFQYTTKVYEKQLKRLGIQGRHSRCGNCHDNACIEIECFFSHLNTEKLYLVRPKTAEQAYETIQQYIKFYNYKHF